MTPGYPLHKTTRTGLVLLATAGFALAAAGCGSGTHGSPPAAGQAPVATTAVSPSPGPSPQGTGSSSSSELGGTSPTNVVSASVGADLAAVQSDETAVNAGTQQSDADFGAGTSAQAQNDGP